MIDTNSPGHIPPTATLLVIALILMTLGVALAWSLYWWVTHKRRGAEAIASVISGTPPARGAVTLYGTVETEEPDRPAITVTLWEDGEEKELKNGNWSHTWTERRRETKAEPFYLALTGSGGTGARTVVRVEPDDDVFLVDKLDALEGGNPRTRRAELTNGEKAYVSGVVGRGRHARLGVRRTADSADTAEAARGSAYRGGPTDGLVLRPGRERMLVSTEPLDRRYVRLAKAHRLFTFVFGLALALAGTVVFGPTLVTEAFGKTVDAEVMTVRHWTTSGKNGTNHHYAVSARYTDERGHAVVLSEAVNEMIYDACEGRRIARLPFVVAFDNPLFSCLGIRVTTDAGRVLVSMLVIIALFALHRAALRGAREWYDKRCIVTDGEGRL